MASFYVNDKSSAGVLGAGIVFIIGGIIALVIFHPMVIRPAMENKNFEKTSCTVVEIRQLKNFLKCQQSSSRFPCVQVIVVYDEMPVKHRNDSTLNITKGFLIYKNENMMENKAKEDRRWCSYFPDICDTTEDNRKEVEEFVDEYGKVGESYSCFYNGNNPEDVIITMKYDDWSIFFATFFPCLSIVLGLILAGYMTRYMILKYRR